jgi:hypothetical protein
MDDKDIKPNLNDFIELSWVHTLNRNGDTTSKTITEHIHKDIVDIFHVYIMLTQFIDIKDLYKHISNTTSKRQAVRKYARVNNIKQLDISNLLKSYNVLSKIGHNNIITNIRKLIWENDMITVESYKSIIQFIKDIDGFDKLESNIKEELNDNLLIIDKYDNSKLIKYVKLLELSVSDTIALISNRHNRIVIAKIEHDIDNTETICKIDNIIYKYEDLIIVKHGK